MSRTLVTGANGFLARVLARMLRARGVERLVAADITRPGSAQFDEYEQVDVSDDASIRDLIARVRPDRVFHFAGVMGTDTATAFRINAQGTVNLLEAVKETTPHARVLIAGSAAEYGSGPVNGPRYTEDSPCAPRGAYGESKLEATKVAQRFASQYGVHTVVVRPFNIIGAGMRDSLVVGALAMRIARAAADRSDAVVVGNLDAVRDFVAVDDVAGGCVAALERGGVGEIYNICTGVATTIRSVAESIIELSGRTVRLEVDPNLDRGADSSVGDPSKTARHLEFTATKPLQQTLKEVWEASVATRTSCAPAS